MKIFSNFLQGNDYHDALAISDCSIISLAKEITGLCSPSNAYGDMMAGNLLVAIMGESDIVSDIRNGKMGLCVENGNSEKMAHMICHMCGSKKEVDEMKENSRKVFRKKYENNLYTKTCRIISGNRLLKIEMVIFELFE